MKKLNCWRCGKKLLKNPGGLNIEVLLLRGLSYGHDTINVSLPHPICEECISSFRIWIENKRSSHELKAALIDMNHQIGVAITWKDGSRSGYLFKTPPEMFVRLDRGE